MTISKKLLLAAAAAPVALFAVTAQAQSVGTVDIDRAVQATRVWTTTNQQIQTTYATQVQQIQTQQTALRTALQPQITAIDTNHDGQLSDEEIAAAQRSNPTALQTIQQRQQAFATQMQPTAAPIQRAQAYLQEQVGSKIPAALNAVMTARHISVVVRPEAVLSLDSTNSADLTAALTAELDRQLTTVAVPPPATWQPGAAGARPATAAPATGTRPTTGARPTTGR